MEPTARPGRLQLTLLQERSGGTFARVYLAEIAGGGGINRLVAVKVLRDQWSEADELKKRTRDEARMLARLRHPNIVRVEDLVEIEGRLAIVMEFVNGVDLQQLVEKLKAKGARIPRRTVYSIIQRVASAIDAAWRKTPYGMEKPIQVVHRDIKPSNTMVTPEGEVKVLDFGTARASFEERSAKTSTFRFGSLKYMSPERREGDRGEVPGDVYALGLVALELLHGSWLGLLPEPPDHANAVRAAIDAIDDTGMPTADWDEAVRTVLAQMCADRPEDRPSPEDIAKLFRAFADSAAGASLEAFCADVVGPLAEQIHGDPKGVLSGTRVYINANELEDDEGPPRPSRADSRSDASPRPESGRLDAIRGEIGRPPPRTEAPPPPPRGAPPPPREAPPPPPPPPRAAPPPPREAPPPPPPPPREPPPPPPPRAEPPPPPRPEPPPEAPRVETPRPQPTPPPRSATPPPARPFSLAKPPPPEPPPPPPSGKRGIAVGLAVMALAFFLVAGLGGTALVLLKGGDAPPAPPPPAPSAPSPLAALAGATLDVEGDDTVQWVKLEDRGGKEILKGDHQLHGNVEPGPYTLRVKVVGQQAAVGPIEVGEDSLMLRCTPQKGGKVRCTERATGALVVELE